MLRDNFKLQWIRKFTIYVIFDSDYRYTLKTSLKGTVEQLEETVLTGLNLAAILRGTFIMQWFLKCTFHVSFNADNEYTFQNYLNQIFKPLEDKNSLQQIYFNFKLIASSCPLLLSPPHKYIVILWRRRFFDMQFCEENLREIRGRSRQHLGSFSGPKFCLYRPLISRRLTTPNFTWINSWFPTDLFMIRSDLFIGRSQMDADEFGQYMGVKLWNYRQQIQKQIIQSTSKHRN